MKVTDFRINIQIETWSNCWKYVRMSSMKIYIARAYRCMDQWDWMISLGCEWLKMCWYWADFKIYEAECVKVMLNESVVIMISWCRLKSNRKFSVWLMLFKRMLETYKKELDPIAEFLWTFRWIFVDFKVKYRRILKTLGRLLDHRKEPFR